MSTSPGDISSSQWTPVIDRGDGAWIGLLPSGTLGVGTEREGRASLKGAGYIPLWPFLEGSLARCMDIFSRAREFLAIGGVSSPERLVESAVASAWGSGRPYWMKLAAPWVIEMASNPSFDQELIADLLKEMSKSDILATEIKAGILNVLPSKGLP